MNEEHLYAFEFYREVAGEMRLDTTATYARSLVEAMEICGVLPSMLVAVRKDGEEL